MNRLVIIGIMIMALASGGFAEDLDQSNSTLSFNALLDTGAGFVRYVKSIAEKNEAANLNRTVEVAKNGDELEIRQYSFRNSVRAGSGLGSSALDNASDDDTIAAVIGTPLMYPNPFRQSSEAGGRLGYELSKDLEVEIQIYNMLAYKVAQVTIPKGAIGARKGYNKVLINQDTFGTHSLSAGVYFFLIMHAGDVLAKGKMAVIP